MPVRIGSWVVGWEVNRHGGLVVVGQPGQQTLDHVRPLICQVPPLVRVSGDVEQPDVFVDGGFVDSREGTFQVPPATGERWKNLMDQKADVFSGEVVLI